jgi:membrane protein implicated in regulation of membrane protease activity
LAILQKVRIKKIPIWQKKISPKFVPFIILGLTFMFFFDDLLLVFLIKELKFFYLNGIYYIGVLLLFLLTSVGLAIVVFKMMQTKPRTGKEGLIDQLGVVIKNEKNFMRVAVNGEIWQAICDEKVSLNEKVRILSVDGLTLSVKKES